MKLLLFFICLSNHLFALTGIICSHPMESIGVKQGMEGAAFHIAQREGVEGTFMGHPAVFIQSRPGKVSSAIAATILIEHFSVDRVLYLGSCGAVGDLEVGDLVLGQTYLAYDIDSRPFKSRYTIPMLDIDYLEADLHLLTKAEQIASNLQLPFQTGLMLTADRFLHTPEHLQEVRTLFPQALSVDMESASVAQTCFEFGIPCLILRFVSSDIAHFDRLAWENFIKDKMPLLSQKLLSNLLE